MASVAMHTGAGSMPAAGGIFLLTSHGVWREVPPMADTYGYPLKNLPNQNARV